MDFKQLHKVDKTDKYSVWGFIRQSMTQYKSINIPDIICYLCLQYLWICECFVKVSSTNQIEILEDGASIRYVCDYSVSNIRASRLAVCKAMIDSNILQEVQWRLKINTKWGSTNGIEFQIASGFSWNQIDDWPSYHWGSGHTTYSRGCNYNYPVVFGSHDAYIIILDTKDKTIKVKVENMQDNPITIFYNINVDTIQYKLFISLRDRYDRVRLLDFKRKYYH